MHYYCDCPRTVKERKRSKSDVVRIHRTTVDSEEICTSCGYYAIASLTDKGNSPTSYNLSRLTETALTASQKKVREGDRGRWQDYYDEHSVGW